MKAKEYAAEYKANPTLEKLGKIAAGMLSEMAIVAETRHAKSDEALISIINEQIDKWRAFAGLAGDGIKPDGLKILIRRDFPFIPESKLK